MCNVHQLSSFWHVSRGLAAGPGRCLPGPLSPYLVPPTHLLNTKTEQKLVLQLGRQHWNTGWNFLTHMLPSDMDICELGSPVGHQLGGMLGDLPTSDRSSNLIKQYQKITMNGRLLAMWL